MKWCSLLALIWLLSACPCIAAVLTPLQNCDPANPGVYDSACQGSTVCFNATATSGIAIPANLQRKYLLVQSQSTVEGIYLAVGLSTAQHPLIAVVGQNTIQLGPQATEPANYEVGYSLASGNSPTGRAPTGAIALITSGPTVAACIIESDG